MGERVVESLRAGLGQKVDPLDAGAFEHSVDERSTDALAAVARRDDEQRREAKAILRARALHLPAGDLDGLGTLATEQ